MLNKTIDRVLDLFETYVCSVMFAVMCCIILIQVVFRVSGLPLAWTEELARYLFVWIIYLAASKAVKNGKHMSVDLLPLVLKGRAKYVLYLFANVVSLVFFLILCAYGFSVLQGMTGRPQYSAASHINMILPYAAPTVGSLMMTIRGVQNIVGLVREMLGRDGGNAKEVRV